MVSFGGMISRLRGNSDSARLSDIKPVSWGTFVYLTRGNTNRRSQVVTVVTREDVEQMLKEGDEFIASYEKFKSKLDKKEAVPN